MRTIVFGVVVLVFTTQPPTLAQQQEEARQQEVEDVVIETQITVTSSMPDFVPSEEVGEAEIEAEGAPDLAGALRSQPGLSAVRRGSIMMAFCPF